MLFLRFLWRSAATPSNKLQLLAYFPIVQDDHTQHMQIFLLQILCKEFWLQTQKKANAVNQASYWTWIN